MVDTFNFIVNKYKLDIGRQYIVDIPNMGRNNLAELFAELNFKVGAEIGVAKGDYSEILCKANPGLHLYSVDPWRRSAYDFSNDPKKSTILLNQEGFDGEFEASKKKLAPYNCTLVRKMSMDALNDFEDNSLDFVYIDANHDFPNFINDLHNWLKKVKPGGIISGHDYCNFSYKKFTHIKRALDAYARCYRMIPFFIIGSMEHHDGFIRDRYRSWMWVKE